MVLAWIGNHSDDFMDENTAIREQIEKEKEEWKNSITNVANNKKEKGAIERIKDAWKIANDRQNKLRKAELGPGGYYNFAVDTVREGIEEIDSTKGEIKNFIKEFKSPDVLLSEDMENLIKDIPIGTDFDDIQGVFTEIVTQVGKDIDAYQIFDAVMGTLSVANSALSTLTFNVPLTIYKAGKDIDTTYQNQKLLFGAIEKAWVIFIHGDMLLRHLYKNSNINFCKKAGLFERPNFRAALDQALLELSNTLKQNARIDMRIMDKSINQLHQLFGPSRTNIHDSSDNEIIRKIQIKRWLEKQQIFKMKPSDLAIVVNRFLMYTYVDGVLLNTTNYHISKSDGGVNRSETDFDQAEIFTSIWEKEQPIHRDNLSQLYVDDIYSHISWLRKKWRFAVTTIADDNDDYREAEEVLSNYDNRSQNTGGGGLAEKNDLDKWYAEKKSFDKADPTNAESNSLKFKIDVNLLRAKFISIAQSYKQLEHVTKAPWSIDYFNFEKIGNVGDFVFEIVSNLILEVEANFDSQQVRQTQISPHTWHATAAMVKAIEKNNMIDFVETNKIRISDMFAMIDAEDYDQAQKFSNIVKAFALGIKLDVLEKLKKKFPKHPDHYKYLQESCLQAFAEIVRQYAVKYRREIRPNLIDTTQKKFDSTSGRTKGTFTPDPNVDRERLSVRLERLRNEKDKTIYDIKKMLGIYNNVDIGIEYPHLVILDDISDIKEKMSIIISEHFDELYKQFNPSDNIEQGGFDRITEANIHIMKRDVKQRGSYVRYLDHSGKNEFHIRDKESNLLMTEEADKFNRIFEEIIESTFERENKHFTEMCHNLIFEDERAEFTQKYKLLFKIWRYVIQPYSYLFFGSSFLPAWNQELYDFGNTIFHCFNSGLNKHTVTGLYTEILQQLRFKTPDTKAKNWTKVLIFLEEMSTTIQERQKTEEFSGKNTGLMKNLKRKLWRVYTRSDPGLITRQLNSKVTAVTILKNEINTQMVIGQRKSDLQAYCKKIPFIPDLSRTPDSRDNTIALNKSGGTGNLPMYKLHSSPRCINLKNSATKLPRRISKSPVNISQNHTKSLINKQEKEQVFFGGAGKDKKVKKGPHEEDEDVEEKQDVTTVEKDKLYNLIQGLFKFAIPNCTKCTQKQQFSELHDQIQRALIERENKQNKFLKEQDYTKNTWPSYYASHRGFIEGTYQQQIQKTLTDMETYKDFFYLTFVTLQQVNVLSILYKIKTIQSTPEWEIAVKANAANAQVEKVTAEFTAAELALTAATQRLSEAWEDHASQDVVFELKAGVDLAARKRERAERNVTSAKTLATAAYKGVDNDVFSEAKKEIDNMIFDIIRNAKKNVDIEDSLYNGQKGVYDKPPKSYLVLNDMVDWLENNTNSQKKSFIKHNLGGWKWKWMDKNNPYHL